MPPTPVFREIKVVSAICLFTAQERREKEAATDEEERRWREGGRKGVERSDGGDGLNLSTLHFLVLWGLNLC